MSAFNIFMALEDHSDADQGSLGDFDAANGLDYSLPDAKLDKDEARAQFLFQLKRVLDQPHCPDVVRRDIQKRFAHLLETSEW